MTSFDPGRRLQWLLLVTVLVGCDITSGSSDPKPSGETRDSAREPTVANVDQSSDDDSPSGAAGEDPGSEPEPATPAEPRPQRPEPTSSAGKPPRETRPERPPELPDLTLEVLDPDDAVSFRQQLVIDESCEVLDECATETGLRSLMALEFTLHNEGNAPLELGSPWEEDIFQSSSCDQAYIPGLFAAELRDSRGRVVSRGSLATKCIASQSGTYRCGSQGLGVDEVSKQPEGSCNFLDVTELDEGDYTVRVTVNPDRQIMEGKYDNNTVEWPVTIDPVEAESCGHIQCGATCCPVGASCEDGACTMPDLRVNYEAAADPSKLRFVNRSFGVDSCEAEEMCVGGSGTRRLLLFEGRLENWGPGDLDLGPQEGNPLFTYSECHGHYHTQNFAQYLLRNTDGSIAAEGHKQGYCLSDMSRINDPDAPTGERPPAGRTTPCNRLTAGYADIYDTETPCQWIDVTGVSPGEYVLEVTINPDGHIAETDTDNNTIRVPVRVPSD